MSDAFDSDVLIHLVNDTAEAASVRAAVAHAESVIGSVVLLPETLSKPLRLGNAQEYHDLVELLSRFSLKPVDVDVADASISLAAKYGLRAADAIHLATAVVWGAERFHTNNRKDFGPHITEVEVAWPSATR